MEVKRCRPCQCIATTGHRSILHGKGSPAADRPALAFALGRITMRRTSWVMLATLLLLVQATVPIGAQGDRDCTNFATQEEAQAALDADL